MTPGEIFDVLRDGIFVLLLISAPPILAALVVGVLISLLQALTQIQEMTLTFVPKMVAMLLVLIISLPFISNQLEAYTHRLMDRVTHLE